MAVAVVVPAYNASDYLSETLASVAAQTDGSWHCIVVDDGSTDTTPAIAQRFADTDDRFSVLRQPNSGVAAARNSGFAQTSGEFVLFLDADDMLAPHAIESLKATIARAPDAPAAHGRATVIDQAGVPSLFEGYEQEHGRFCVTSKRFPWSAVPQTTRVADSAPTGIDALLLRNPITTPGQVLIRRSALEQVASFDPRLEPAEDWAMWLSLSYLGSFEYLPQIVIRYRKHDAGVSAQLSKMRSAELRVRRLAIQSSHALARGLHPKASHPAHVERLGRLGLRSAEWIRARQRASSAMRHVTHGKAGEAMRDVLRAGSSLQQIVLSLLGLRSGAHGALLFRGDVDASSGARTERAPHTE